jgi:hypothetical protein
LRTTRPPCTRVANQYSGDVSVLLGTGSGSFEAAVSYPAGTAPESVAVGDLNSDGKAEHAAK